MKPNHLDESKS